MSWTLVGFTTATPSAAVPSFTLDAVTGVEQGDQLITVVGASSYWMSLFPPAQWNARAGGINWWPEVNQTLQIWDKIATADEPSSYQWTMNSGYQQNADFVAVLFALRPSGGTTQWDSGLGQMNQNSSVVSPSITLSGASDAAIWCALQPSQIASLPTGWTEIYEGTNQGLSLTVGWNDSLPAGATGAIAGGNATQTSIAAIAAWLLAAPAPTDTLPPRQFFVAADSRDFFVYPQ